jgi:hypothetical protein
MKLRPRLHRRSYTIGRRSRACEGVEQQKFNHAIRLPSIPLKTAKTFAVLSMRSARTDSVARGKSRLSAALNKDYFCPMIGIETPKTAGSIPQVWPLSVNAYHALGDLGLIPEKTERLYGQVFHKMPKSPFHRFLS